MLEGLAIWALFIYILRLLGVPWKTPFKLFAYIGGGLWLGFVWIGLINFTPMDLSGGSVMQSPQIQLRPGNTQIKGKVAKVYVSPNSRVEKGQLIFELDPEVYEINERQARIQRDSAIVTFETAQKEEKLAEMGYQSGLISLDIAKANLRSAEQDWKLQQSTLKRYLLQNAKVQQTITERAIEEQKTKVLIAKNQVLALQSDMQRNHVKVSELEVQIEKAKLNVQSAKAAYDSAQSKHKRAVWDLQQTKVYAPVSGFVTNFILREGQYVGAVSRMQMFSEEKYVLMRVNHQAIRNVKAGQLAEFASPVYPGKVFAAQVQGIVEATGESEAGNMGRELSVSQTTQKNLKNKYHFVRLKITEPEGYDIPVGAVGLAWISGEKPSSFLSFLDAIRGIIIRMKAQLYYIYSV